jgi:hypothetical protein
MEVKINYNEKKELCKIIAQERISRYKSHRSNGINDAFNFIKDVRDLKTLCFDKRLPTFKNKDDRYFFWSQVLDEIQ